MKHLEAIRSEILESANLKEGLAKDQSTLEVIEKIVDVIVTSYKQGGKVLIMGNGGSAADAQHIAAELVSKFKVERRGLAAIALSVNTSVLTAIGNDYGFDRVFSRQVEALCTKGDIAIGISTSGNSKNVIEALLKAKQIGATIIGFTGKGGSKISEISDYNFSVPSSDTPRIQEVHITVGHIICGLIERELI